MNMYHHKDILIISTLLNICTVLFSMEPTQLPDQPSAYAGKLEFFKNRKPSIELNDLIAIIQATDSLPAAAQALDATKKRVVEKINASLAPFWMTILEQTYSDHVATHITFEFEHEQTTVSTLFARYHSLEQEIIALYTQMPNLDDEHKSDHYDAMLAIIVQGKTIEEFLATALAPQTPIAHTWTEMSKSMLPVITTVKKSMDSYIPYKTTPAAIATFNSSLEALRLTKTLKAAQQSYASTQAWIAQGILSGNITPPESTTWPITVTTAYNDQTTKTLPQLQIAQMYAKSLLALKTLKGYQTV